MLASPALLTLTPYQRRYQQPIRDLMFHSNWVHAHLDWYESDDWLEAFNPPTSLGWQNGRLHGLMSTSKPLNEMAWLRLVALRHSSGIQNVLPSLWHGLAENLRQQNTRMVGILGMKDWLMRPLPALGFEYVEDIITLERRTDKLPPKRPTPVTLRAAEIYDIEGITRLDHVTFEPPWQLSFNELRQAQRCASSTMVAVYEGEIVGYQFSTFYFDLAHLARIGVHPKMQGQGVGAALLDDVLERFMRRGVYNMTVNTQGSNAQSRHLYERFGFVPNGYDLPYWRMWL